MVMGVFKRFLKYLETLFVHQHVILPISSGGIRLSFGSWALIALVITFKFLLNYHPFLLEVIGVSSLESLPFQAHLRSR